jgi:hypothetical protein
MDHSAGLDVSVKETSICIVDDTGRIIREVMVASEPEALLQVLKNPAYHFKRIGLEAGPMSQWLYSALAEAGLPVICVETRHMRAVLKAQINKTDRNDARGIAQMMRVGLYRPVHVKTLRSQKLRMLLTHRKLLQSKAIAIRDFKHPDSIVVGSDEPRAREVISELYRPLYLNRSPIMFTDLRTAELIKYAANAFLATKITFINEIADLAEKVGADVQEVARGIGLDNRIGSKFLHAGPGFGGSCFPKDAVALLKTGLDHDVPLRIVEAVAAVTRLDGGGRVQVLLQLLGREVPVSVSRDALMPARAA